MDGILDRVYYNLDSPALYGGILAVLREAKRLDPSVKLQDVKDYLEKQYVYTMHKPARRRFPRNKIIVPGPNYQHQIDLSDMVSLKYENDSFQYIFTCIDVFSKYAWGIPVKNKSAEEIVRAYRTVIQENKPRLVQSDEGKEFLNKKFQALLSEHDIKFFTSKNRDIKCSIVERFNRTMKTKIWKHFSKTRSYRYIDVLPQIIKSYNNAYHRSIKMKPKEVTTDNTNVVRRNLYKDVKPSFTYRFKVGDKVKVSKAKGRFEKGYLPNWSEEIFSVKRRLPHYPPVYILEDYGKEEVDGLWYEPELQKVVQEVYWIEKIIKRGKAKSLVKWAGYPEKFNSWIPNRDIKRYG